MSIRVTTMTPSLPSAYRPQSIAPTPVPVQASSIDYGQGIPVQNGNQSTAEIGGIAGAVGGGFIGFKWMAPLLAKLLPSLAKAGGLPGLAVAGVVGACAAVGGYFGYKLGGG
ncbi:MAG TPA: hypothetical protein V6D47_03050 [Oscillatoriaceae cyanobacterium]